MIAISCHTHPESQLTGSTLSAMIKRCSDLGRTHFSYTDSGHLSSCLKAYGLAKKANLKFAAGLEMYLKDPLDDIITGTEADRCKYFTVTVFAKTQEAYQELCRTISRTDLPKIEIQGEEQSLFDWKTLEHLAKFEILTVLGGPHDLVGKVLLASNKELAEKIFLKLYTLYGERLSVSLVCEPWNRKYASVIKVSYQDGTYDSLLATDTVTTDKARKIKASDLITRSGHNKIESKISGNTFFKVGKYVDKVTEVRGFLPLSVDVTLEINKFLLEMSKKYRVLALVSDYAFYASKEDHIVQTMVLENTTKLKSDLHMKTEEEFYSYLYNIMKLSQEEAVKIVSNNNEWAKNFDAFELKYEIRLADSGSVPALQQCMDLIKKNGRMKWDNPEYVARLREEINVIAYNGKKDLSGYFLPIAEIVTHYRENGKLTGPARGSAGGSLFCYLMGLTHLDPIPYGLSFQRFLSLDRIKNGDYPDVDTDFGNRELLLGKDGKSGFLYGRWGNRVAQASTRNMVRLKSAVKDTNRYFNKGTVEKEIESFSKALPNPPQGIKDLEFVFGYEQDDSHVPGIFETYQPLKDYAEKRPAEWIVVQKALGITRAHSQHASAFCISDAPLQDILPIKNGHITQYEAKQVEAVGILKYDLLTVSNIEDIEVCINLINQKNKEKHPAGYFTHNGKLEYVWHLPYDLDAYKSCWDGNTVTLFQINSKNMSDTTTAILPKSIEDGSAVLALERPGPKDFVDPETGKNMVQEYISRRNGESKPDMQELYDLIPETYGIITFQEQSLKISKELGGMSPADAEKLRRLFSKKQKKEVGEMKPTFMSTAIPKIGEEKANKIWDMMETSSRYSFNLSHSTGYFLITYACLFLRHNYPLEWWAAILTNATQKEISGKLWSHVRDMVAAPDINLSSDEMEIDYANGKIRSKLGMVKGMQSATIDPIIAGRPYLSIQDFVNRDVAGPTLSRKLIHVGVLDSLFPPKSALLQKMQLFEDAVEIQKYNEKVAKAAKDGKPIKATEPKKGKISEQYLTIEQDPLKNAATQKAILPSLLVGLYDLGRNHSKCIVGRSKPSKIMTAPNGNEVLLVSGEVLQRLNEMPGDAIPEDKYVAACGFVVETKIFDYKNNTRQALKIVMDFDGFVKEFVCWPDYFTFQLTYPPELAKGQIVTMFLKKRAGKDGDCSIQDIVIETV